MFNTVRAVPISAGRPEVRAGRLEDRRTTEENERAVDQTLADSFPASDPPPWTLGIAHPYSEAQAFPRVPLSSADAVRDEGPQPRGGANGVVIVQGGSRSQRTMIQWLATLAGAMGVALLVPIAILIVGLPVVLVVRGVVEAVEWATTFVLK